ncbi:hypothetical protein NUW58_g6586 [Xylaria curta]|uniref:Uncharacterized protein n=1 Tax=Xylaria curta TaxID=42375 RepID=A0ACC1NSR4_9PEZI|nr:hypothetical protein NUW58_g6586 [Xylaria curta]
MAEFTIFYNHSLNPYHDSSQYANVQIEGIPPSAAKADLNEWQVMATTHIQVMREYVRSKQGEGGFRLSEDMRSIICSNTHQVSRLNALTKESSVEDIELLIEEYDSLKLELDLNRLARFAICMNALAVVEYLVDKKGADLTALDIFDRSAVFYICWDCPGRQVLKYIASKIPQGSKHWNQQDILTGRTPLHYATARRSLDSVEFLLAVDADAGIRCHEGLGPIDLIPASPSRSNDQSLHLLFNFKKVLEMIPESCVFLYWTTRDRTFCRRHMLDWLHLPHINGILAFSILRRYARDRRDTTHNIDGFLSSFLGSVNTPANHNLPYADPFYEFNYGNAQDDSEWDIQTAIIDVRNAVAGSWAKSTVQSERTLDEMYFPSLSAASLDNRNNQQVVSRECRKIPIDQDTEPILMVTQLWLWGRDCSLFTAFSADDPEDPNLEEVYKDDISLPKLEEHPLTLIGLLIAHQVSKFGHRQVGGASLSPLDIFEASVAQVLNDVDEYMDRETLSRPQMKEEHSFMFRIADIREELVMMQEVLGQQLEIVEYLAKGSQDAQIWTARAAVTLSEALECSRLEVVERSKLLIEKYQKRIRKIDGDAERVEKRIQDQLNLKRTHVSINDARSGLILSTAIIGFTVITIIYAPLAFVTALFALPLDILLRNQFPFNGTDTNSNTGDERRTTTAYTTGYVGTWFAVAEALSLVVTVLLVMLCLWLLGGTESFATLQGNRSSRTEPRRWYYTGKKSDEEVETVSAGNASSPQSDRPQTGLRNRAAKLLGHRRRGTSSQV